MKRKLIIGFIILVVVSICLFIYFTFVHNLKIELLSMPLLIPEFKLPEWKSDDGSIYSPSNSSIISAGQQYIMNIRYIRLLSNDKYKTKNLTMFLDSTYKPIGEATLMSENYQKVINRHEGLEDIRLFYHQNQLKCIASCGDITQEDDKMVIVIGDYDIKNKLINNIFYIESPRGSSTEKNWCYIEDEFIWKLNQPENDKMNFIYSWYPLSIGYINGNSMNIYKEYDVPSIFKKFRGSTIVVKDKQNNLWCLVHEQGSGKYYHYLVQLEYGTMKPLYITNQFVFSNGGIEYCIGFNIDEMNIANFIFTVNSINPALIRMPLDTFTLIPV